MSIQFNTGGTGDEYFVTNIIGLDGAPIRAPVDDAPQTDGGIVHSFFLGPRHVTVEGLLICRTGSVAARNILEANLLSALFSCLRNDATWSWTPTGLGTRNLTVRNDLACSFTGSSLGEFVKSFSFGLVAANPIPA